ncbi:MAG: MoxR family ATPase [Pirellulales bacterium]
MVDIQQLKELIARKSELLQRLQSEIAKAVVGQEVMVSRLLIGLLTGGHVLLEGVPGLAKTTAVNALAKAISVKYQRIQFTPDLLPADLIGTMIYVPSSSSFTTRKGPVFANLVLADEINRAPSKVQSALLEAMQERQVTIGDETFPLPSPFLVLATQNPIEQEGTYPLPEAQTDRFMLKVRISYPKLQDERKVLDMALDGTTRTILPVIAADEIFAMQEAVRMIYVDDQIKDYILNVVTATRRPSDYKLDKLVPLIEFGASPRATIFLGMAARANAFLQGRGYVTPQDIKDVAYDVLRHRILLTYEAEAEEMTSDDVIRELLSTVPVP